jgi:hypothetical protein
MFQRKTIAAPHKITAILAMVALAGAPRYLSALRTTPTTAIKMYGRGIRKRQMAKVSGRPVATVTMAAAVATIFAIVP